MERKTNQLPVISLTLAGLSALSGFALMAAPLNEVRGMVFVVCLGALAGLVLGIVGIATTRGEPFGRRLPAGIGILLGGIVFLWFGLIFWLSTPF
ncbi:hypothetical protein N8590_01540 [bacterium]|nr:hypothetical protein [bacterium]MDB4793017.1 hypothetical protein [bacterium]